MTSKLPSVLVFAGAGASTAVNSSKFPTTAEFYRRLPNDITSDKLFKQVVEYLGSRKGPKDPAVRVIDIEEVLWTILEIRKAISWHPGGSNHPLAWLMQGNRLQAVLGGSDPYHDILKERPHNRTILD